MDPEVQLHPTTAAERGMQPGAPGYDPFGPDGANVNLLVSRDAIDQVSGSVPHRAYLCEIRREE